MKCMPINNKRKTFSERCSVILKTKSRTVHTLFDMVNVTISLSLKAFSFRRREICRFKFLFDFFSLALNCTSEIHKKYRYIWWNFFSKLSLSTYFSHCFCCILSDLQSMIHLRLISCSPFLDVGFCTSFSTHSENIEVSFPPISVEKNL